MFQYADKKKPRTYRSFSFKKEPENWKILNQYSWCQRHTVLEIGCGKGDWIIKQALQNPHVEYIAIEKTKTRSDPLLHSAQKHQLKNLLPIRADAIHLLDHKFPKECIDEMLFHYPNPWPKKKQANKRFFPSANFSVFHKTLKKNGLLYLVSNIEEFVIEAKFYLENFWSYNTLFYQKVDPNREPRTAFEKKYLERGEFPWELQAQKI